MVGISGATAVSVGSEHACALLSDGIPWCWGSEENGELGNVGRSYSPTPITQFESVLSVTAARQRTCLVLLDGSVRCLGINFNGFDYGLLNSINNGAEVRVGREHACVRLTDGRALCWGENGSGQLGTPTTENNLGPVEPEGLASVIDIATGSGSTCAVLADGTVWCWGHELGNGGFRPNFKPQQVPGLEGVTAISGGIGRMCALLNDGTAQCWSRIIPGGINGTDASMSVVLAPLLAGKE